jgi:hypothetical protein
MVEIGDIVSRIPERGDKTWIHPDRVAADGADVIELAVDSFDISDAIPVRIQEGLRIEFVKDG